MDYFHLRKKLQPNFSLVIPFLKFEKELERELLFNSYSISKAGDKFFIVNELKTKPLLKPLWAQEYLPNCEIYKLNQPHNKLKKQCIQPVLISK